MSVAIPPTIEAVTPEWLTEALHESGALGRATSVASVETQTVGTGVGILGLLAQLTLTYDGETTEFPTTMVVKMASPHPETKDIARFYGFYTTEVGCYRAAMQSGDGMGVRVPDVYAAHVSENGGDFVILMEDLSACRVADQITGASVEDAEHVIDLLARFHGHWWENSAMDELHWLRPLDNPAYLAGEQHYQALWPLFASRYGDRATASAMACAVRFGGQLADFNRWVAANRPMTIGHADLRLDNVFFDHPGGTPVMLIDWQLTVRNMGAYDVSYFLVQSMGTQDRLAHGQALLRRWYDGLLAAGVTDYSWEDARADYRRSILGQLSISVVGSSMDPGNDRGRLLFDTMVLRNLAALDDENAAELLLR